MANSPLVNLKAVPEIDNVIVALDSVRQGKALVPKKYESGFHILRHTEMFDVNRCIKLRFTKHHRWLIGVIATSIGNYLL
ncbi:MAG: hypothetical protein KAF91_19075 [Nostoc sp. TH1S01]|nr:hypothetical protein [Nostoc sp. TH1S01]